MSEDSHENKMPITIYINGKPYPGDHSQPLTEEQVNQILAAINKNMNGVMGVLSENLSSLPVIGKIFEGQRLLPQIETNIEDGTFKMMVNGYHLLDLELQDLYQSNNNGTNNDE